MKTYLLLWESEADESLDLFLSHSSCSCSAFSCCCCAFSWTGALSSTLFVFSDGDAKRYFWPLASFSSSSPPLFKKDVLRGAAVHRGGDSKNNSTPTWQFYTRGATGKGVISSAEKFPFFFFGFRTRGPAWSWEATGTPTGGERRESATTLGRVCSNKADKGR